MLCWKRHLEISFLDFSLIYEILLNEERTNTERGLFRKRGKSSQTDFAVPSKWTVSLNRALV